MSVEQKARYAYEAYRSSMVRSLRKRGNPIDMKTWAKLAPVTRRAWIDAVEATLPLTPEQIPTCAEHKFTPGCPGCIDALMRRGILSRTDE